MNNGLCVIDILGLLVSGRPVPTALPLLSGWLDGAEEVEGTGRSLNMPGRFELSFLTRLGVLLPLEVANGKASARSWANRGLLLLVLVPKPNAPDPVDLSDPEPVEPVMFGVRMGNGIGWASPLAAGNDTVRLCP